MTIIILIAVVTVNAGMLINSTSLRVVKKETDSEMERFERSMGMQPMAGNGTERKTSKQWLPSKSILQFTQKFWRTDCLMAEVSSNVFISRFSPIFWISHG